MTSQAAPRNPAFDPFGEPMDLPAVCTNPKGYGETRRAALVFWALALIFLGSRIYLSDAPAERTVVASAPAAAEVVALR